MIFDFFVTFCLSKTGCALDRSGSPAGCIAIISWLYKATQELLKSQRNKAMQPKAKADSQ
jgi:hypothetical protein